MRWCPMADSQLILELMFLHIYKEQPPRMLKAPTQCHVSFNYNVLYLNSSYLLTVGC